MVLVLVITSRKPKNQMVVLYWGLKDVIKDKLQLNDVWSMSRDMNLALKVEMQLNQMHKQDLIGGLQMSRVQTCNGQPWLLCELC